MSRPVMELYLSNTLPSQYTELGLLGDEPPVESVEALATLYQNKYGTFGPLKVYIYDPLKPDAFIEGLRALFARQNQTVQIDIRKLESVIDALVPMLVVDDQIITKGIYPDLLTLRGGSNSISRGGTGHHH